MQRGRGSSAAAYGWVARHSIRAALASLRHEKNSLSRRFWGRTWLSAPASGSPVPRPMCARERSATPTGPCRSAGPVSGRSDVKVNPHSIGADFEFLVGIGARTGRLQEGLRHIAVPQMVTPTVGFGVGEDEDFAVAAFKPQVEGLRRP